MLMIMIYTKITIKNIIYNEYLFRKLYHSIKIHNFAFTKFMLILLFHHCLVGMQKIIYM